MTRATLALALLLALAGPVLAEPRDLPADGPSAAGAAAAGAEPPGSGSAGPAAAAGKVTGAAATAPASPTASAAPAPASAPTGAAVGLAAPSLWAAALRAAVALGAVALLMVACVAAWRWVMRGTRGGRPRAGAARPGAGGAAGWLTRWLGSHTPPADRIEVRSRAFVGGKESVCVIAVGGQRFLLGVTGTQVSLLAQLPPVPASEAGRRPAAAGAEDARRAGARPHGVAIPVPDLVPAAASTRAPGDPAAPGFAQELARASAALAEPAPKDAPDPSDADGEGRVTEASIRAALAAARERLARRRSGDVVV